MGRFNREMITGSAALVLPSFLPFYFRVCAFSIQRTRLSRSLKQATMSVEKRLPFAGYEIHRV